MTALLLRILLIVAAICGLCPGAGAEPGSTHHVFAQENSSEELCFRYLAEEDFLYRSHIVLSVTSIDQNSIYLSQESSKESWLKFSIVTIITGCLLFVLTSMIPVIFLVAPKIKSI